MALLYIHKKKNIWIPEKYYVELVQLSYSHLFSSSA